MKVIVLGAGLVGGPMAADLAQDPGFEVGVVDINREALVNVEKKSRVVSYHQDLSNPQTVRELIKNYDLVLSAVPGFLGFQTLKATIEAGKNVVDIAFFPEDPFELDGPARQNGVAAVVDCGVAPGMSHVLAGYAHHHLLDETESVVIYVGGLPQTREWPYEYKAVFSPLDVIEEYIRPARFIANGEVVVRPALSDPELIDFPGIGTLEAFNSDGLRTLIRTRLAPHMKEKTLRYPGHIEKIAVLRETGFFGKEEIVIGGAGIRPLDLTAKLLSSIWKMGPEDRDLTVMQVKVAGKKEGRRLWCVYDLLDRFDEATGVHSMARTTGYAATAAVRMLAKGLYSRKGVSAPEHIGEYPECVEFMLKEMEKRGIRYSQSVQYVG